MLLTCFGCQDTKPSTPTLLLYCGAGIRPPVAEAAKVFGQEHGVKIECDFAGSETLLGRIQLTNRGDLYMPGDVHYIEQARDKGLIARSETACYFVPVMLVAKGNPQRIQALADLTRPGMKVALGDPEACAIGRKSAKIFAKNNLSDQIEPNVVFRSLTVNELGTQVKMGMVDVAIVWDAVAAYYVDDAEVVAIPVEQNVISTVPVGILSCSRESELAGQFVEFITSDSGAAIFHNHHYMTEPPE